MTTTDFPEVADAAEQRAAGERTRFVKLTTSNDPEVAEERERCRKNAIRKTDHIS